MTDDSATGTMDLEKGLRPSRSSCFLTIAVNAMLVLLLFNASALKTWTDKLPSSAIAVSLSEAAAGLVELTKVSPHEWGTRIKRLIAIGGTD